MAVRECALFLLISVSIWSIPVNCQDCARQISCGSCISQTGCAWCFENVFNGIRCQPLVNLTLAGCMLFENPSSNITSTTESTDEDPTINFDRVKLNLRVGDPQTFTITVTPQRNLPLDLYILIDLSTSMNDELSTVQSIASQIADQVRNVTTNVRLGFGSFVEKPIQPFTEERLDATVAPDDNLNIPYSFRHTVNFTSDSIAFSEQIVDVRTVGSNVDLPEAGFEGLAQVITCEDIVGWRGRENGVGTRLVLFMTDEEFHFAGEGILAGIVRPYNGMCLLMPNPDGGPVEYTRATEFDYPSVGQILDLLQRFDVTAIFAVAGERMSSYQNLVDTLLMERAVVSGFSVDQGSSTQDAQAQILSIIEEQYVRLLQRVSLDTSNIRTDPNSADVTVQVVPICPDEPAVRVEEGCELVPLEAPVNFDITLTLNSCEGLTHGQLFRHNITTSSFGSFELEFTVTCNCSCALLGMRSDDCMGMGVRRCAVCECDPLKCGVDCSQNIGNRSATDCPRGGVDNQTCSGPLRGECDCTCICVQPEDPEQMVFGNACQCDNFRCPRTIATDPNSVCSGRGMCCDGGCICDATDEGFRYRGAAGQPNNCQCEPRERVCIQNTTSGVVCNDRGTCGCNFCICTDRNFTGTFCDLRDISTCNFADDENCIRLCRSRFREPSLPDICTECNLDRPLLFVNRSEIANSPATSLERIANIRLPEGAPYTFATIGCSFEDGNCITEYNILGNETHYVIVAVRERDCSNALNLAIPIWALAPIILGGLLILGILLLILIKIIFTILDYMEVKKWQKEAQGADFSKNTNPLYQSPEMKYENVAYGKE